MLTMIDKWLDEVEKRPLTILNLNRPVVRRPKVNWKWLLVLVYFLVVLYSWKTKKPKTSLFRILFSPLLLVFRRQ